MIETLLKKTLNEFTQEEKDYLAKKIEIFTLSDEYLELLASFEKDIERLDDQIDTALADTKRDRTYLYSHTDKNVFVTDFKGKTLEKLGDSEGALYIKKEFALDIKKSHEANRITIDPRVEELCYTAVDWLKLDRVAKITFVQWVDIIRNRLLKSPETQTEKGAY